MESSSQMTGGEPYPVQFSVQYPDRELNRLTSAFRLIVAIPILIVAASIGGDAAGYGADRHGSTLALGTGLLFLPPLLMIVFRRNTRAGGSTGTSSCSGSRTGSRSISL